VILPDVHGDEMIDLGEHFDRQRVTFFSFLLALLAVSIIKDVVIDGELPEGANLLFHAVLGSISIAAMLVRSRSVQTALAVAAASGFAIYIAVLFATL
jgi:hypothetical protein